MGLKHRAIAAALRASALMQRMKVMAGARGRGAIFTLHQVRPYLRRDFDPNRHLEITPDFLGLALERLRHDGYRFVALDEVPQLLAEPAGAKPFAAFTLDDGYRNNHALAVPVFERFEAPFTVFACKGLSERSHGMWWETLAVLLSRAEKLELVLEGKRCAFQTVTITEKARAFAVIAGKICQPGEAERIEALNHAARAHGIDPRQLVDDAIMTAGELGTLGRHPLASLGAHGVSHRGLAFLDDASVLRELTASADYLEAITGTRPLSFAYPYGDARSVDARIARLTAQAGFRLAVTTRPGTLAPDHGQNLLQLPRISLNGFFQHPDHVSALASGIVFSVARRLRQ
ncbi:polysaccharide deacetylase family protein [Allorhizobium undicola]|uniref:polysaccharide deacetylase family protein n=1 Tax=Allorhizobium undicola TaxID=78527 RepID=UPI0005695315|nr:polysaccharide deacetylase family protein [Allorhizobium undicola]